MAVDETTVSELPADVGRPATVLFADVSESTKLYETAGDVIAQQAIGRCLEMMKKATEAAGGRVVKTIGDEVMAIFRLPDAAAAAAAEMQGAVDLMPIVAGGLVELGALADVGEQHRGRAVRRQHRDGGVLVRHVSDCRRQSFTALIVP